MKTNCDVTWYTKTVVSGAESWARTVVTGTFWEDRKAANVIKSGLLEADRAAVYIPAASGKPGVQIGDVLVKGAVTDEITTSFTITDLKAKYPNCIVIKSVDDRDFGSARMQHLQIGGS